MGMIRGGTFEEVFVSAQPVRGPLYMKKLTIECAFIPRYFGSKVTSNL